jgi:hypothetical protein
MNIAQYTNWIRQVLQHIRKDHEVKGSQARWKIGGDIKFNCVETATNARCDICSIGIYSNAFPTLNYQFPKKVALCAPNVECTPSFARADKGKH